MAATKTSFVHISSIAASINGNSPGKCEYAKVKKEADEEILKLKAKNGNVVVLRPGVILPNPTAQGIVNMGHDYSPEQFGKKRFIPIVGSGNQVQQPIGEECLYEGAINGVESETEIAKIFHAVSSNALTQKEMVAYFS